jgi:hypothetical protein
LSFVNSANFGGESRSGNWFEEAPAGGQGKVVLSRFVLLPRLAGTVNLRSRERNELLTAWLAEAVRVA